MIYTITQARRKIFANTASLVLGLSIVSFTHIRLYPPGGYIFPADLEPYRFWIALLYIFGFSLIVLTLVCAVPRTMIYISNWRYGPVPVARIRGTDYKATLDKAFKDAGYSCFVLLALIHLWIICEWYILKSGQHGHLRMTLLGFMLVSCLALVMTLLSGAVKSGRATEWLDIESTKLGEGDHEFTYKKRPLLHLIRKPVIHAGKPTKDGFLAGDRLWVLKDMCLNVLAFGAPGSGKTRFVLYSLLRGYFSQKNSGGLFLLDVKGTFATTHEGGPWENILDSYEKLRVINGGDIYNPCLDGDPEEAAMFLIQAISRDKRTQEDYWMDNAQAFLSHAITLLRLFQKYKAEDPPDLFSVIQLVTDENAIKKKLSLLLVKNKGDEISAEDIPLIDKTNDYFMKIWMRNPPKFKATIANVFTAAVKNLTVSDKAFLTGETSFDIDACIQNEDIVVVDLRFLSAGALPFVATLLKERYFNGILGKKKKDGEYPFSLFLADEYHAFYSSQLKEITASGDAHFFSISREYNHINIVATQNINQFYANRDKASIDSFLGNCSIKVFLQNTDIETRAFAAKQVPELVYPDNDEPVLKASNFILGAPDAHGHKDYGNVVESYIIDNTQTGRRYYPPRLHYWKGGGYTSSDS